MAKIRGIEYRVADNFGERSWVQFGDSLNDLAYRGYPSEQNAEQTTEGSGVLDTLLREFGFELASEPDRRNHVEFGEGEA